MDSQPVTPITHSSLSACANDAIRRILPPDATQIFSRRAERFRTLAVGHPLGDWLAFLAQLSDAQQYAADRLLNVLPLSPATLEQARAYALPPLSGHYRPTAENWRDALRLIHAALRPHAPDAAGAALDALDRSPDHVDTLALALVNGHEPPPNEAYPLPTAVLSPFVAAALQVVWTLQAARIEADVLSASAASDRCPCCGSPPVASTVRLDEQVNNLRYLHCALCNTAWNRPRATCTACGNEAQVAYRQIEGSHGAVRGESCDACGSYLKIVYQDKAPDVDPVADDLATLALDLLLDEAGYARSGPNYLLAGAGG